MIESILVYLLISIGVSQLWSHSKIFSRIRILTVKIPIVRDALLCPVCASYWMGLFVSLLINPLYPLVPYVSNIACGVITYLVAGLLYKNNILNDD
jgi:hypothetical protein